MRRRDLMVIGGAVAVALAIPPILRRIPSTFEFSPMAEFPGFRVLQSGNVSGGADPFFGLSERLPDQAPLYENDLNNLCLALFGADDWAPGTVPVAIFNDFNCPFCKLLETRLIELVDQDPRMNLTWHDMPLLGEGSRRAARAALAARFADKERQARAYLWNNGMRPGPTAQDRMAQILGLDAAWFRREMGERRVGQALLQSLTLGTRLGIYGTPGTVIGRTLVIGDIRPPDLAKLIELERSEGPIDCTV